VADLAQEARLRVAQCALDPSGWDPARGTRFATYACTAARRRCYEVTLDAGAAVRVGRGEQRRVWREGGEAEARLRRARRAVSGDMGRRVNRGRRGCDGAVLSLRTSSGHNDVEPCDPTACVCRARARRRVSR
jgi:hypothetical protein